MLKERMKEYEANLKKEVGDKDVNFLEKIEKKEEIKMAD